jgi:G3E family GTPase
LEVAGLDTPVVIHGVQHVFHPPVQLEAWPDAARGSKIVFITRDLEEEMFASTLAAFNEDSADLRARLARPDSELAVPQR